MQEASFYGMRGGVARCLLCPHRCAIIEGRRGICGVREHKDGKLYALTHGKPCSMAVDPIEKKPLYHFLPGQKVFSLATVGCNLSCKWCQNHDLSHPQGKSIIAPYGKVTAQEAVTLCKESDSSMIAFTYTEPTVFFEYMLDIARLAKKEGLRTVMVSNGYIEEEPLSELIPHLDAANIDLKAFNEKTCKEWTGARLEPVLRTIKALKDSKVHLETTTLIVPGVNDDEDELEAMYTWIARELGKSQVVHLSRFFPHYQALGKEPTPLETLRAAESIASRHLDYVYVGNVGGLNDTHCPSCGDVVISRSPKGKSLLKHGRCACGARIPGVWG